VQPAPAPKAPEFNPAVHAIIDPVVRPLGYTTRTNGAPTWKRKLPTGEVIFFRIHRRADAADPYSGGQFGIEFEHARDSRPYASLGGRAALDQLLMKPELELVVHFQKQVISSLARPPRDWVAGYPEFLRETYLSNFDPNEGFRVGNFAYRFLTMNHVEGWGRLVAGLLPVVLERAQRLDPGVIYLGSPIDLDANPLRPIDPIALKPQPPEEAGPPRDPAWRPAPRGKKASLVCGICGKPIGPSDITAEKVGYPGIYHFECHLREMSSSHGSVGGDPS
jgi:hypothetical protein